MIQSIDHINLVVRDLNVTTRFYTELLDFREVQRVTLEGPWIESIVGLKNVRANVAFLEHPQGGPRFEILQYHTPASETLPANSLASTGGLRHVAFRVDDMAPTVAKLRQAGVKFLSDPVVVPGGILPQTKVQKSLCYFHDPDGVLLELAEYRTI